MAALFLLILWMIKIVSSQVDSWDISIGTDGTDSGMNTDTVTVTLYWNNTEAYQDTFTPDGTIGKTYTCDTSTPVTVVNDAKNFLRVEYTSASSIAINFITVTLTNANVYTIDHFCISSVYCTNTNPSNIIHTNADRFNDIAKPGHHHRNM